MFCPEFWRSTAKICGFSHLHHHRFPRYRTGQHFFAKSIFLLDKGNGLQPNDPPDVGTLENIGSSLIVLAVIAQAEVQNDQKGVGPGVS
jgi:hypothetical protein